MGDVVATLEQQTDHWDAVAQIQQSDCCRDNPGKCQQKGARKQRLGPNTHELRAALLPRYKNPISASIAQLAVWAMIGASRL